MEDTERTLIILLSMHRSGSSLTTNILQTQGMSLGPWELHPPHPSNPHGHFESVPILELTLAVQTLVYGFRFDMPESPEAIARFLETQGQWDDRVEVPDEYVERGRALIRSLLDSGKVSGFKDPRSVLLWPFWQRVLSAFPTVRVVPLALLRSPHEIAMSLFTRREGECGYWACLDVVAVHLQRLQAILEGWSEPVPRVRFGGLAYFSDLEPAIQHCGMEWDPVKALHVFDGSCVHHVPAVVAHRAQCLYDSLCGAGLVVPDAEKNAAQIEADGRARDQLQWDRIIQAKEAADQTARELSQTQQSLAQVSAQSAQRLEELEWVREEYRSATEALKRTNHEWQLAVEHGQKLAESARDLEERLRITDEHLARSLREGNQVWLAYQELQDRFTKLESHPVIGLALKGRRELRNAISRIKTRLKAG
jgi:hypothetical protein